MWKKLPKRMIVAVLLLLTIGLFSPADAQQPADTPQRADARPCVLLRNGNVLFGTATQRGQWVVVRRDDTSEIQLSRHQVACWADSLSDLYQYRVDHRPNRLLESRLADVRWCLQHDLYDLAAKELSEIYALAPDLPEARRLELRLRSAAEGASETTVEAVIDEPPDQPPISPQAEMVLQSQDHVRDFSKYLQPLLINRCGQCHSHTTERTWQLVTPAIGSRPSARMTVENLKAALAYVEFDSPDQSELLLKAQSPHGGEPESTNRGVDSDPRRAVLTTTILQWIRSLQGTGAAPQHQAVPISELGQLATPTSSPSLLPAEELEQPLESESDLELETGQESFAFTSGKASPSRSLEGPTVSHRSSKPQRLPRINNPFDPDLFNRQHADKATDTRN